MKELVLVDKFGIGHIYPPHIEKVAKVLEEVMARNEWEINDLDRALAYLKTEKGREIVNRFIRDK